MIDCQGKKETLDFLGYMVLCYPDFPPEVEITADGAFEILLRAMNSVKTRDSTLREEAMNRIEDAKRSHRIGNLDAVSDQLQMAWASLNQM